MDASWFEPVRAYCERGDAGFWAEPVNALTNAAFLIAAGLAARRARGDGPVLALAAVTFVVGIGSFLFHTLANRWSMLADVIPIASFIYGYFALAMTRFFGFRPAAATALTLAFAALGAGLTPALDTLTGRSVSGLTNGSVDYAPAILALLGVGLALLKRTPGTARSVLATAGVFLVSLAFRTVDVSVCARLPLGTHFLWHGLNAVVLYRLLIAATQFRVGRAA
ncbi:ceramidase domain-containing protein [Methylobacterium sp. B4]|uniref:ceramidase domain-containing protein n=1 Tax=Methylobacterium sp. B4 TaxID=1938755 RepID=UPI000D75349C|nr:ceramidase domain-containing protein [Methylobacterium sp. B4]PXW52774.1 ceramidase [Methylobacterium sp. B4]